MTERFYPPVFKFTTDTLKSLPFAVLKFYATGTTTPKAVYADKFKTSSLGVTVPADSAGNFPPIFLDGIYRVELVNAAGDTQTGWPVDNYGGAIGQPFDEWSPQITYGNKDLVTETVTGDVYYFQSKANANKNFRPTTNITKWKRVYFPSVAVSAAGKEVSSSGVSTAATLIANSTQLRVEFSDEKATGIMNILAYLSGVPKVASYFVSAIAGVVELADISGIFVASNTPAAGQVGIYSDNIRSVYIKNRTGGDLTCSINVQGVDVVALEDIPF